MIPQSRPDLKASDFAYIREILRTRQVAGGQLVERLESAFKRSVKTKHAAATSSGTAALHLGLLALGVGPGDEVMLPSYTCASVLQAVQYTGAEPRLLDIDEKTLNVTKAIVRGSLTRRTKILIVTHTFGFPAPLDELMTIGVPVIEDCALALGATYHGRPVGSLGILSIFSMYATKVICAGEGGMLCTNEPGVIRRIRDLNRPDQRADWRLRYNYKLSDLAAGLAFSQMRRLASLVARRRAIAARYQEAFGNCAEGVQHAVHGSNPSYYRFIVRTPRAAAVIRSARLARIACDRPVFKPLHRYFAMDASEFQGTEAVFRSTVSVPIYPALSDRDVSLIAQRMKRILSG